MRYRLSVITLLMLVAVLALVSATLLGLTYRTSTESIDREITRFFRQGVYVADVSLRNDLATATNTLEQVSRSRTLGAAIVSDDLDIIEEEAFRAYNAAPSLSFDLLFVQDQYGSIRANLTSPLFGTKEDLAPLSQLSARENWHLTRYRSAAGEQTALIKQHEIVDGNSGKVVGKLVGGILLNDNISLAMALRNAMQAESVALLNGEGVLVSTHRLDDLARRRMETLAKSLPAGKLQEHDGELYLRSDLDLPIHDHTLSLLVGVESSAFSDLRQGYINTIVAGLVTIILSAMIGTYIIQRYTGRPLNGLMTFAKEVTKGNVDSQFSKDRIEEFNELGDTLETMVASLVEKENYIYSLFDSALSPTIAWDRHKRITAFNRAAERLFGKSRKVAQGSLITSLFKPETYPELFEAVIRTKDGQTVRDLEVTILNDRLEETELVWSFAPVLGPKGEVQAVIAQGLDITDRKRDEKRRRLSETVLASTSEGILVTDSHRRAIQVNDAFTKITGYTEEDILGHPLTQFTGSVHDKAFYKVMWKQVARNGTWQGEILERRKDGRLFPAWLSLNTVYDERGRATNYIAAFADVSSIKDSERKIQHLAHYDPLTDLPNRTLFNDRLKLAIAGAERRRQQAAVLLLDLDHFKKINDTLSHKAGDELLVTVAERLKLCVMEEDTVSRQGGDEFSILLPDVPDITMVEVVCRRIIQAFSKPFEIKGEQLYTTASIGVAMYPNDGTGAADLLRNADAAMFHAKAQGRNGYQFHNKAINTLVEDNLRLENKLRRALEEEALSVYYQPKFDVQRNCIVGFEALIRWFDEEDGFISPADFIPVAEDTGLIAEVGRFVMTQAIKQAAKLQQDGYPQLTISINLSAREFHQPRMVQNLIDLLVDHHVPASMIQVELTESVVMENSDRSIVTMEHLLEAGVTLALDDFGTGYSSLSYLKRLPIETLKIDRDFIRDLTHDKDDESLVIAILSMAHRLHLDVVAEGVETEEQLAILRSNGCSVIQGFLISQAVAADQIPALIDKHSALGDQRDSA